MPHRRQIKFWEATMKKRKISALALAIILSSTAFASCKKDEVKNDGENNVIDETPTVKGENELGLPDDLRFDGETFNMYLALSTLKSSYIAQEDAENLLAQTVYKRNELVKQRLGIDLNIVCTTLTSAGADQQTETNKISSLILAGDKTYDVFAHVQHTGMPGLINEGMFLNWNDMPYIDLTKPWWYSNALRDITFGDKIFCMTGDYNLPSFSNTECLAFNKTMLDELEMEYPYQSVLDGTWTHDKFVEYIQAATKDLNGDGQMDWDNDRYGFAGWAPEQIQALYVSYGGQVLEKDDHNMPVLSIYSRKQVEVIDKMLEVFNLHGAFTQSKEYGLEDRMFENGRLLFNDSFLSMIQSMRNYDNEIGFIPYPKINEEQEDYRSRTANVSGLTYIPITLDEERYDLVGATLETMAYYSNRELLPTYFDIILTVQSTRDVESEQMIPIIRNTAKFMDMTMGFQPSTFVTSGQNTLASHWMSSKSVYEEKLATLIKTYSD